LAFRISAKNWPGLTGDVRLDYEIERDTAADVILLDYELWVVSAVADHQTDAVLLKFKMFRK
jgi:hypothetical protein